MKASMERVEASMERVEDPNAVESSIETYMGTSTERSGIFH